MKKITILCLIFLLTFENNAQAVHTCTSDELNVTCFECGSDCTARFDLSSHTLTVSGTGKMTDYTYSMLGNNHFLTHAPWSKYIDSIKHVSVNGVSSIGEASFLGLKNMERIDISDSVKSIGAISIDDCEKLTKILLPSSVNSIGEWAFFNNPNVTEIILSSTTPLSSDRYAYSPNILKYEKKNDLFYMYDQENNLIGIYTDYNHLSLNMYKNITDRDTFEKDNNGNITLFDKNGKILGKYDKDGYLTASYIYHDDGSLYVYGKSGNLLSISGKRIYTVEEASLLVRKGKGNTFSIKYR